MAITSRLPGLSELHTSGGFAMKTALAYILIILALGTGLGISLLVAFQAPPAFASAVIAHSMQGGVPTFNDRWQPAENLPPAHQLHSPAGAEWNAVSWGRRFA
jgi:hypothetical protein